MPRYSYQNPNQPRVDLDLPAEGEIFRNPNDPRQGEIYKRQGGQIKVLKETQFRKPDNAAVRLGDVLSQQGINYGGIREVSPEALDVLQSKLGHTFTQGTLEDFRTSAPQNIGESYTQGIDLTNPNTGIVSRFTPSPITTTGEISGQGKIEPFGQMNLNDRNAQIQALQSGISSTSDRLRQLSQQRGIGLVPQFQQQFPFTAPQITTPPPVQTGTPPPVSTGAPVPTATTPSLQDRFFEQLIENMKQSQGETDADKKLKDIIAQQASINASRDLGIQAVGEQPIATPFITGQQAAITSRALAQSGALAAQSVPLQQQLVREQAKRQSALDVSKLQLEYQQAKEKAAREGAYTLSEGQQRYDASGKLVASGASKKAEKLDTSIVDIGGRRLLVNNQTGATIKDLGVATKTGNPVLDALREFELEQKTKATPGQVVNATTGYPAKLTDTQSQFLSQGQVLRQLNQEVKDSVNQIGTNALRGWVTEKGYLVPVVQKNLVNDPAVLDLMQKMYALNNLFVYFSTGKQINETEFDRLSKQTPNFRATTEYNQKALTNFENNIKSRMDNYLRLNGWKINQNQSAKIYNNNDPLGIR